MDKIPFLTTDRPLRKKSLAIALLIIFLPSCLILFLSTVLTHEQRFWISFYTSPITRVIDEKVPSLLFGMMLSVFVLVPWSLYEQYREEKEREKSETYSERLSKLTTNLDKSSEEVEVILAEMKRLSAEREASMQKLEKEIQGMEEREQASKKRIQDLENVPLAVAEHFAKLTEPGEKRGARRDYTLFFAGLVAGQVLSIIGSIVLKAFGY